MSGWIKLHRKIRDHWLYQERRQFSRFEAWIDLLMRANYTPKKILLGNELIDVDRGQFVTSIRKLIDAWNWSNTKVYAFLDLLQGDGMIDYESDTKKTVITIVNYSIYHDSEDEETTQKRNENETKAKRKHTEKKDKELIKKDKEDIYRQFKHLKMTVEEFERLISEGYTKESIDSILDQIENYKKNKNYTSLLLTARNWLRREGGQYVNKPTKSNQKLSGHDTESDLSIFVRG